MISIVLPSFNGSKYLCESIESIITQTYQYWELILVDDCSTDNTLMIMQEYQERYPNQIRCIHNDTNKKLSAALNTGFAASKGEFLTWTSDDNLYKPDALEKMVNFLLKNPDASLVYADYSIIDEFGKVISDEVVKDPKWILNWSIVRGCFLYRREVYQTVGNYSEDKYLTEDHDYWLRVYQKFTLLPLHENLYKYRYHPLSLSYKNLDEIRILKENMQFHYINKIRTDRQIKIDLYSTLIRSALKRRELSTAILRLYKYFIEFPLEALKFSHNYLMLKLGLSNRFTE